ncbi:hypothetical protein EJF36_14725 [Bacillus sp. HMF5848]|uniref:hypothetical protein n=1 Tax=Bacillus sp. HMF5848 TaxID=2495421 RepID=UPI000F76CDE1|nr:hypothetical protein [Bacillus sp. HMF5848]RSK28031.1 hypothetical protein EJF36_14725 [Bacillus sp. HMF5848]
MNNERGSSLLLVLLVTIIIMTLGLTILSVSIGGAKRTEIRYDTTDAIYSAMQNMDKVILEFKNEINNIDLKIYNNKALYQVKLNDVVNQLKSNHPVGLTITDITADFLEDSTNYEHNYYSRVYKLEYEAKDQRDNQYDAVKTITRQIILSPTPSFLEYAVGSFGKEDDEGYLTINGSANIQGNMYANVLTLSNYANYKDDSGASTMPTPYSAFDGSAFVQKRLLLRSSPTDTPIGYEAIRLLSQPVDSSYFYKNNRPTFMMNSNDFVEIDFDATYDKKEDQLSPLDSNATVVTDGSEPNIIITNEADLLHNSEDWIVIDHPSVEFFSGYTPFNIDKNIYVNGDLTIVSEKEVSIKGNIITKGDLTFQVQHAPISYDGTAIVEGNINILGNDDETVVEDDEVNFNAVMFAKGKGFISNTNIAGLDDKQLVLLTKEDVVVTRINEFASFAPPDEDTDIFNYNSPASLKAFFYTDKSAIMYGVGSNFFIHGGVFAKKSLEINAIRGNIIKGYTLLKPSPIDQTGKKSRFTIIHDSSVLTSQLDALPQVDRLRFIVGEVTIN